MYMRICAWPELPETVEAQGDTKLFQKILERGLTFAFSRRIVVTVKGDGATGFRWLLALDSPDKPKRYPRREWARRVP